MTDLTKIPYCIDCGSQERHTYWGGGPRCKKCSDRFRVQVQDSRQKEFQRKRDALSAHIGYWKQHGECPDDGIFCESCCPHEETDHGVCVECETDISDELACAAHEYCEGDR